LFSLHFHSFSFMRAKFGVRKNQNPGKNVVFSYIFKSALQMKNNIQPADFQS